jgi:hypothetical protein
MEQQALATFNHAAEQRRYLRGLRWTITNYALIAYAALAVAPSLVDENACFWRALVSVVAVPLVWAAFGQAYRLLADMQDELDMELRRLHAALEDLPLISKIHARYRQKERSDRRGRRRFWILLRRSCKRAPADWLGFFGVLFLGAIFASLIILSRMPWPLVLAVGAASLSVIIRYWRIPWPRVVACVRGLRS